MAMDEILRDVYKSGERFRYLDAHPITFADFAERRAAFRMGASKASMDVGFDDQDHLKEFMRGCQQAALDFKDAHNGASIADGK